MKKGIKKAKRKQNSRASSRKRQIYIQYKKSAVKIHKTKKKHLKEKQRNIEKVLSAPTYFHMFSHR